MRSDGAAESRAHRTRVALGAILLGFVATSCAPRAALGWSDEGHRLIAGVAAQGLSSSTKKWVRRLLGANPGGEARRMEQVSSWADDVRGWLRNWSDVRRKKPTATLDDPLVRVPIGLRTRATERDLARKYITDLIAANPGSKGMKSALDRLSNNHYTNLPLGTASYESAVAGTGPDDCVNAILRCVRVLKGSPQPSEIMNKQQAIRFLIHYVGDLHQPLHAGVGYWRPISPQNAQARLCSAHEAATCVSDSGGNKLRLKKGEPVQDLHRLWDGEMVRTAREAHREFASEPFARVSARFREFLVSRVGQSAPWMLTGTLNTKVRVWAVESAGQSSKAYATLITNGLQIKKRRFFGNIVLPPGYTANCRPIVSQQLSSGGLHLAMVLNSI